VEKIIVSYNLTDGCTYTCDIVEAIVYESIEAFYVDFEEWIKTYSELWNKDRMSYGDFVVNNTEFQAYHFMEDGVYYMPDIETLEEWFNKKVGGLK
jgi:hypothetical protein